MNTPGFGVIRAAARIVPAKRREEWRQEWEAETAYAWQRLASAGRTGTMARLRLRVRVLSCFIDALMERKEEWRMTGILNDLRYALRGLARNPAFTAVAVLTLALGIGANSAVFTLVDGVLVRPLPFNEPDRLLSMRHLAREGQDRLPMSEGLYLLYREQVSSLEGIALYVGFEMNMVSGEEPERIQVQGVTPSFFQVLGASPTLGRAFLPEEEEPDAEPVVMLSHGLWQRSFGGDSDVIGHTVDLNGTSARIVGVMPPDFGYPDRDARAWVPYTVDPAQAPLAGFGSNSVARMAPGSTVEGVRAEISTLLSRLEEIFPESGQATFLGSVAIRERIEPLKEALVGNVSTTLWILLGTVGFVLLIACANVANLLLVRAESRQRELALRLAIGAGRREAIRFFMGESVILAIAGGGLGVLVGAWALGITTRFLPTTLPRMAEVGVDPRVLGFTALISLGCALFFGLFPMLRYGAEDLANQLKEGGGRGASGGRHQHRLRNGLVVLQVAMALVLLVGAGLMLRSFTALRSLDPGFESERVLTARIAVPSGEVEGWQETADFFRQLRERLVQQPGVENVGFTQRAPLSGNVAFVTTGVEDHPRGPGEMPVFSSQVSVGEGFIETLGIRLLEGRTFQPGDGADGTRAVMVSESFARHWWPDVSPLGRRIGDGGPEGQDWWLIVGVVGDVHQASLEGDAEEMIYFPPTRGSAGSPGAVRTFDVLVKTTGSPVDFVSVLRRELHALNPRIPLSNPRTMEDIAEGATARTTFTMAMLGAASGIALLLGLVGIYGVISYVVSQRTQEIGVRMALGATAPSVQGMVVRQGVWLSGAGVVVGLVAAGMLSRVMSSLLFGVSAMDPLTYGTVALTLVGIATLASWLPARRAAAVDPSRALREE